MSHVPNGEKAVERLRRIFRTLRARVPAHVKIERPAHMLEQHSSAADLPL